MPSILIDKRLPNKEEQKHGAEIVFERVCEGRVYTILGHRCHESWEQWGAPTEILGDNVDAIERWRKRLYRKNYED